MSLRKWMLCFLLITLWTISACQSGENNRREIEGAPGGFTYSDGQSEYTSLYRTASELLGNGEYSHAEAIYRQIIEKAPEEADGYIGLGTSLLLQERHEEAKKAYDSALAVSPDSIEARIGLGSASFRLEAYPEAAAYYGQALELDIDNPNAHWGLGITLQQLNREDEALQHFLKVVELAPGTDLAIHAEEAINELR